MSQTQCLKPCEDVLSGLPPEVQLHQYCDAGYLAAEQNYLKYSSELRNLFLIKNRGSLVNIAAVQHIRRMRGGAQGHLMRCSDNQFYVVKFLNNPQHIRVLTNEYFATGLAESVGLPVPATAIVEVGEWLINHTPELNIQMAHRTIRCEPGLHLGSRYVVNPLTGNVIDYLPTEMLVRVRNVRSFAGMLALDKWTGNADGRQAAFWRLLRERKYTASFIDQGYCFNGGEWTFPDYALRGVFSRNEVYAEVQSWESFEPWLPRVENIDGQFLWLLAEEIPPEWYGGDWSALEMLIDKLILRRGVIRDLITAFRLSPRRPFPAWDKILSENISEMATEQI